jgi:hypothetical protein
MHPGGSIKIHGMPTDKPSNGPSLSHDVCTDSYDIDATAYNASPEWNTMLEN